MQLGPDGKIYIAGNYDHLDVINNPDRAGLACYYAHNAISLGHIAWYGITNFIDSYNYGSGIPECDTASIDTTFINEIAAFSTSANVYSDPFNYQIVIEFSSSRHPLASFELYNEIGQLVLKKEEISAQKLVIAGIFLPNGMYLYTLYQGRSILKSGKLVLQQ